MTDYNTDVVIFRWIMTIKIEPKSLSPVAFAGLKICKNAFAAGAPPRTRWRSSQRSPETTSWICGAALRRGRKMGGQEREGKGRKTMEGRRWQGRGRAPESETVSSR